MVGSFPGGTDDLFVALMADQQNVVVLASEALGLVVHLGDQWAGRVDHLEVAGGGRLVDGRGHAVRREHHDGSLGHFVRLVDEYRSGLGQGLHDMPVVHDLVAHVHRRAMLLQCAFDGLDGAIDSGAVPPRLSQ